MLRWFRHICAILSTIMAVGFIEPAWSEDATQPAKPIQAECSSDLQVKLNAADSRIKQLEQIVQLLNKNAETRESPLYQRYREAKIAEYDNSIATMKYTQATLNWVLYASNVSLWLVSFIVLAGVAFSGFQLWQGAGIGAQETKLEVGANQFRLTSSVVGIIVLGMSFFFFYLFVKEIYTVKPLPVAAATQAQPGN